MAAHDPRPHCVDSDVQVTVQVDPPLARFSAWYELFPRSASAEPGRHGTLRRRRRRASPYVAAHGLRRPLPAADPPDRPRRTARARTTRADAGPDDPGSPWAIGAADGGHTADPPGARHARRTSDRLVAAAREHGHRDRARPRLPVLARPSVGDASTPSGSARAPTARSSTPRTRPRSTRTSTRSTSRRADWRGAVGRAARASSASGSARACTIFRVDNPHTKPFPFWEWLIGEVKARPPRRASSWPRRSPGRR